MAQNHDLGPIKGVCGRFLYPDSMPSPIAIAIHQSIQPRTWERKAYRVTDLSSKTPQQLALQRDRWEELTAHAEDFWSMASGTAVHGWLEQANLPEPWQQEVRGSVRLGDFRITGTMDVWNPAEGLIADYKVGGLWGMKPEWEVQLNAYALMVPGEVRRLQVWAWNLKGFKVRGDPEYEVYDVPLWDEEKARETLLALCEERDTAWDDVPRPCTDDERWVDKPWKVLKKTKRGAKNPERVVTSWGSQDEARAWLQAQNDGHTMWIERREGEPKRCKLYCPVSDVCSQYAAG